MQKQTPKKLNLKKKKLTTPPVLTGVSLFSMSSNFFGLMTRPERLVFSLSAGVLALAGVLGVFAIGVGAKLKTK